MNILIESPVEPVSADACSPRCLIIYHFFEKDSSYVTNFAHFLTFGYTPEDDFLIVIAGQHTITLPKRENVRYIFTENKNNDYGGYCDAIRALGAAVTHYEHVFFINSSVRGPFLAAVGRRRWQNIFTERLTGDIGLVGSTINILAATSGFSIGYKSKYGGHEPFSHVQTMAYAMPKRTLSYLVERGFYDVTDERDKDSVIRDYEIRLSRLVLENGWNITALLPEYAAIDYRHEHADINPSSGNGDPSLPKTYFGRTAHPFEVVFVKTNRSSFSEAYLDRLAYSALHGMRQNFQWRDGEIIDRYVARIESVRHSHTATSAEEMVFTIDEIMAWIGLMVTQYPNARSRVLDLLNQSERGS